MTEQQARRQLEQEGFDSIYVWTDAPHTHHEEHSHPFLSAHIVLMGEMKVSTDGHERMLVAGDRWNVPAQTPHAATVGPKGCTYLIGEKH